MLLSQVDGSTNWAARIGPSPALTTASILDSRISRRRVGYSPMQLRIGYELIYSFPQPTPVIVVLDVHDSRASDIIVPASLTTDPALPVACYRDGFGNHCQRLVAPPGRLRLTADGIIRDSGTPDEVVTGAWQDPVQDLPEDSLVFLLGSRYCETDLLSQAAWQLFGGMTPGYRSE